LVFVQVCRYADRGLVAEARGRLSATSSGGASSRGAPVGARGERNHFFGSSPFTSNKPKMAPGLQDLGVLVAPSARRSSRYLPGSSRFWSQRGSLERFIEIYCKRTCSWRRRSQEYTLTGFLAGDFLGRRTTAPHLCVGAE
jgi:hypothetical protein